MPSPAQAGMHQAPPDLCGAQPQGTDRMAKEEGASSKGIPENVALPGKAVGEGRWVLPKW